MEAPIPWPCTRDPSLRLKNGFARDEAMRAQECLREIQTDALPHRLVFSIRASSRIK